MNHWLDLFTPHTWDQFGAHGSDVSGFRPRQRKAAFERVQRGDIFLCYLVKLSRWCGVLEVASDAFEDTKPIFVDENDPFTIRFRVAPRVVLDFEQATPIEETEIWTRLSFTRNLAVGSVGWAQHARLRQSLLRLDDEDGQLLTHALVEQGERLKVYALDSSDRRHLASRTVVRTERGEVVVEVPERETELPQERPTQPDARSSLKVQAKVAQLGAILGFTIWIPASDRVRVAELLPESMRVKLISNLPLNYDLTTLKTIENIDVIWLDRRSIAHAFEVEHTTSIYSGLLRMADLLALQPRMNIALHIVAPSETREHVRREIVRPVFSIMEGGSISERCSYLPYEAIDEVLSERNLSHMRETILEDYEEFFDA